RAPGFALGYSGIGALYAVIGDGDNYVDVDSTPSYAAVYAGNGNNCFRVSPYSQWLAYIGYLEVFAGGGSNTLEFFAQATPASEAYTFDAVPSSLTLATVPYFYADWTGISTVVLLTNGASTVDDPSGTVLVDPPDGPPCGPGGAPTPAARPVAGPALL